MTNIIPGKPELVIYSGLPGSGKSTLAAEWLAEDPEWRHRVNYDDLRIQMFGPNWVWNRNDEDRMKKVARDSVIERINHGFSVVIDNTNLSSKVRRSWATLGRSLGAEVIEQDMGIPPWQCAWRDAKRTGSARVGRGVIDRMALFGGYYDWDEFKGDFILVDIDGTVADCEHRRAFLDQMWCSGCKEIKVPGIVLHQMVPGYCDGCGTKLTPKKDWKSFHAVENITKDPPIQPIIDLVKILAKTHVVLYSTGRSTENGCGVATEDWLQKHGLLDLNGKYTPLFMRAAGDHKPDTEAKGEILDLLPIKRINYVLDDRKRVCEMYRQRGLTVLQVAEGNY